MPLPVIGSISDPEAVGLGKLLEAHCQKQTGTLFNGIDIANDDYDTISGYVKSMFVHRIGEFLHATLLVWLDAMDSLLWQAVKVSHIAHRIASKLSHICFSDFAMTWFPFQSL